jgi:hypothetical protein
VTRLSIGIPNDSSRDFPRRQVGLVDRKRKVHWSGAVMSGDQASSGRKRLGAPPVKKEENRRFAGIEGHEPL